MRSRSGPGVIGLLFGVLALGVTGCGSASKSVTSTSLVLASANQLATQPVAPVASEHVAPSPEHVAAAVAAEQRVEPAVTPTDGQSAGAPASSSDPVDSPRATQQSAAPQLSAASEPTQDAAVPADGSGAAETLVAQAPKSDSASQAPADAEPQEYDPWEPFNEKMFAFNYNFDKYLLKPVAKGYNFVMPDELQRMIGNAFDNINPVPKWVNNLLQQNYKGFFTEVGRFLINSTLGIGGLWDIARQEFGLQKTRVDFGQTLGKWGVQPGPYLVLPFLPPLTVRDGIGYGVDGAMDPLSYFIPFIWDKLGLRIGDTINDRSLNLDLFQGFEESTVDMYSAVRNGYLQRRYNLIHGESQ